jgi:hypothetical protein
MGRSLILIVGAAAIFGMISFISGAGTSASRTGADVTEHGERVLAREIAVSGHAVSVRAIEENVFLNGDYTGAARFDGQYQGGTYVSTVDRVDDQLTVVTRANRAATTYVIRATYQIETDGVIPEDVPDFLSYALMTGQDLSISGNAAIRANAGQNASIHTNGAISVGGWPVVEGFGTHVNGASPANRLPGVFKPNDNPDGDPVVSQQSALDLPEFHAEDYKGKATIVTEGSISLGSGDIPPLGTRTRPTIWYVAGDLTINGGHFDGYVIFVVEGDIRISGNITSAGAQGAESNIAFYNDGDVMVAGGAEVRGQIYTQGDVVFEGNATLYGSMTAVGSARFSGTFDLYYTEASPALTGPIWEDEGVDGDIVLRLIHFREGG